MKCPYLLFWPILMGEDVHLESNGTPVTVNINHLQPLLLPGIIIGVFALIGFVMLGFNVVSILGKGGHFVGTAEQLVHYCNGKVEKYDWQQFSGTSAMNVQKIELSFELRTGKIVHRKNRLNRYVPNVIYISGVEDVVEIERICQRQIQQFT